MLNKTIVGKRSRLKSRKTTEQIFNSGKVVYSFDKKLRAHYLIQRYPLEYGVKSSVAVSKKAGKAVWRNRAKRLIREAHRLGGEDLFDCCLNKKMLLEIIFTTNSINEETNGKISLADVNLPMNDILNRVRREIIDSA